MIVRDPIDEFVVLMALEMLRSQLYRCPYPPDLTQWLEDRVCNLEEQLTGLDPRKHPPAPPRGKTYDTTAAPQEQSKDP